MKILLKFGLFFLLVFTSHNVLAWGMTGHRVIASIAEKHLNKKAKKGIKMLIGNQSIVYWSNWADFVKSSPEKRLNSTGSWHFLNTKGNLSESEFRQALQDSPEENLYKAYINVRQQLNDPNLSLDQRREALYYVIHLLADAHQPMHVSRAEDLGGNRIDITFFGRPGNIHRVWDSDLVDNEKYSYSEYTHILDYNKDFYRRYTDSKFEDWLYESHQLANVIYDDVAKQNRLSYDYVFRFKYVMEDCLLKAGLRLAKELNEVFEN